MVNARRNFNNISSLMVDGNRIEEVDEIKGETERCYKELSMKVHQDNPRMVGLEFDTMDEQ